MKIENCLFVAVLLTAYIPSVSAQQGPISAGRAQAALTAKAEAVAFVKAGDIDGAVAKLRSTAKRGVRAASEDAQVVGDLCALARRLAEEKDASAISVVQAAKNESLKALGRTSMRERAYMEEQLGLVYEMVLGDEKTALVHYNAALAADSTRKNAREAIARIARVAALSAERERENVILRRQAK